MAVTYNTGFLAVSAIFRATSGGIVYSANLKDSSTFDYFTDTAVVNDAIYFSSTGYYEAFSDITLNIGTPISATSYTLVWERYYNNSASWEPITNALDETNMLSATGIKAFKFGAYDWWTRQTINGIFGFWVRARLSAVNNLTEGGANTTSLVTLKDGRVNIDGYSDVSPCTPEIVYQYLKTNYPYLGVTRSGWNYHYDFTSIFFWMNSRFLISKCSVETCMGGSSPGKSYFGFLQMGIKKDDYTGYDGGTLYTKSSANSYGFDFSTETKIYGSHFLGDGSGYPGWVGEWIDSNLENINFAPSVSGIVRNCRIIDPGTWIASGGFNTVFDRNSVFLTGSHFAYFYNNSVSISNLDYAHLYNDGRDILYFYFTGGAYDFTFTNTRPALPGVATVNKIASRRIEGPMVFDKVFYHDGVTYTDYTSQFNDTTTNDAPISGEVGDCYYFGRSLIQCYNLSLNVDSSLGSNDYEYAYEYYLNGAWWSYANIQDRTNNLSISDYIFFAMDNDKIGYSTLTINGYNSNWFRIRITKKGTGTKYINQIKLWFNTGNGAWNIYDKYTIDVNVATSTAEAISGANVYISYDGSTLYSGVTDSSGNIPQQALVNRRWFFDPINSWTNHQQIGEEIKGKYILSVSKTGYESTEMQVDMSSQKAIPIALNPTVPIRLDIYSNQYAAVTPETGSSSLLRKLITDVGTVINGRTAIGPETHIVKDGLVLHFDAANTRSYPGRGSVTYDMAKSGETWNMSSNLTVSPVPNGAYIYPDDSSARYAITTNSFAILSPTNTLTYDFWCWLAVPRNVSASNLFNDLVQQNGTPYAWVGANNSHLEIQYLRVTGGWSASQFSNYFVGNSNQWVHVVVIVDYNAPLITAYKNGVVYSTPITPAAIRFPNSVSQKYMGAYQGNAVYNWVGKQAVGKVYNRGLSETEIVQNYNALKSRFKLL